MKQPIFAVALASLLLSGCASMFAARDQYLATVAAASQQICDAVGYSAGTVENLQCARRLATAPRPAARSTAHSSLDDPDWSSFNRAHFRGQANSHGSLKIDAYGVGVHANRFGQAVTLVPDGGGVAGEMLKIRPDAYGPGVHADQYGRPVRERPWF